MSQVFQKGTLFHVKEAELVITSLKLQQQEAANKYAALKKQNLELHQQLDQQQQQHQQQLQHQQLQQQQQQQQQISSSIEDIEMPTVEDSITSNSSTCSLSANANNQQQQLKNNNGGTASSKWAEIAAKPPPPPKNKTQNTKKSKNTNTKKNKIRTTTNTTTSSQQKKVVTTIQINKALSALSAPKTTHQGFTYLYYQSKSRISRKTQRSNLTSLGVNNSRVLDIHYPSRTVVALLVHNDYREEIIMVLKKHGVSNLPDYTPTNHTTISDPQFKNLSTTEKSSLAIEKHNNRLVRALPFIRDHIAKAVARFFEEQSWITKDQLDSFVQYHNNKITTTISNQKSL
ncbi:hypothetical protein BD770DRAFT_427243 [Pilaira anomala]|nr:hypothetical protein BD770DRAFT_427243 [Pilaira anomala]